MMHANQIHITYVFAKREKKRNLIKFAHKLVENICPDIQFRQHKQMVFL